MFIVFGTSNCVWCNKAKQLLGDEGIPFEYLDIQESSYNMKYFREMFPFSKTVPQIRWYDEVGLINAKNIGGYEDLVKYLRLE